MGKRGKYTTFVLKIQSDRKTLGRQSGVLLIAGALLYLLSGCSGVDFVPNERVYEINKLYGSEKGIVPTLEVRKDKNELGHLYIMDPEDPTDDPYLIELTRDNSVYKASAPLIGSNGKHADFSVSVGKGRDVRAGFEFTIDLDLP